MSWLSQQAVVGHILARTSPEAKCDVTAPTPHFLGKYCAKPLGVSLLKRTVFARFWHALDCNA